MAEVKELNSQSFDELVGQGKGVCLVDFFATWCGPCKMLAPTIQELADEGYTAYRVDVDQEPYLSSRYSIVSVPTMIIFKDGEKQEQIVGLTPKERIQEKLDYYAG